VVKLAELKNVLPAETKFVSSAERKNSWKTGPHLMLRLLDH